MFGYESIKDYGERNIDDIFASDKNYENVVQSIHKRLNKQNTTAKIDAKFNRKNGTVFYGHLRINIPDFPDSTKTAVITIPDITWRKQAEKASLRAQDLTIPGGMGGKKTVEKLLEIDPDAKAIVSSGYSNDPVMAEFKKYGFKNVIAKPYRILELGKVLNKVIKGID